MIEDMIEDIQVNSPLGKSDHSVIEYTYNCYIDRKSNRESKFIYDRGNYDEMRKEMNKDWEAILSTMNVEEQWKIILESLQSTI